MSADLPPEDPARLEFSPEARRALADAVLARVLDHVEHVGDVPACGEVDAQDLCRRMRESVPEDGAEIEPLLGPLFDEWVPRSFGTPHPGYLAFIPGGGLFPSALADLIADATNRFTGVWQAAPALVQLEANVLDWIRDWMQFPETTRGLLTTGGSMANLTAVVCAREKLLGDDIAAGVLYTSEHVHLCVTKAARLAGIRPERVRRLAVDEQFRMRIEGPGGLRETLAADRAAGLKPFMLVTSAGTTNTGAVDPLDAAADLAEQEGLWHHVDGAYGGFFHMVPELRPLLSGLSRADSLALDPHKGLFLPYGTGTLLVRDGEDLRAAHADTAGYLPPPPDTEFYDPSQYGPELSRDFRGLRVWLPIKLFGAARLRAAVAEKRCLALHAAQRLADVPGLVMDAPPQLSLFAFHLTWPGATRDEENEVTAALVQRVTDRGRVMITGCVVDTDGAGPRRLARVCVLSFRTRAAHVEHAIEDITAVSAALLSEVRGGVA